ncbi:putative stromalin conservative domain-containing protein [Helianthus debilis subsp. tardiflorus]
MDPEIQMSCIQSLGAWAVSYPSLFLNGQYVHCLGLALSDEVSCIHSVSIVSDKFFPC